MATYLTLNNIGNWLDNSNFRITTDYIFQLYNVTTSQFYTIWISDASYNPQIKVSNSPDTGSQRLDFDIDKFPNGNENSNYRVKDTGEFQLYNVDTGLWHNIWITGEEGNPTFSPEQTGEE